MAPLTREEIMSVLGPVDEILMSEIMKSGATPPELSEAHAWMVNEEALINEGRRHPTGKVGELIELLNACDLTMKPMELLSPELRERYPQLRGRLRMRSAKLRDRRAQALA